MSQIALVERSRLHGYSCKNFIYEKFPAFSPSARSKLRISGDPSHATGNQASELRRSLRHSESKSGITAWNCIGSKLTSLEGSEFPRFR